MKKKYEKAEDFIGWKSEDGLLEVVGLLEKSRYSKFKVICHKCKEDKELFPDGYFVSQKQHLKDGYKPCGCAKHVKWTETQYLILARRAAQGRFIVHGFTEEFTNKNAKLNLECLVDGNIWTASVYGVIHGGYGCSKCAGLYRQTEQEAFDKCKIICENNGYTPLGFPDGYKNTRSRFEYSCPVHGKQNVRYNNFLSRSSKCPDCWNDRKTNKNGYFPDRIEEQDYLYVLDFDTAFIKVGRSFDIKTRIGNLKRLSKIKNIVKLKIFTGTHQEIYYAEQEILKQLRLSGFQHNLDWTKECFKNNCIGNLYTLLNTANLKEVFL